METEQLLEEILAGLLGEAVRMKLQGEEQRARIKALGLQAEHAKLAIHGLGRDADSQDRNKRHQELAEKHWERDSVAGERMAAAMEEMADMMRKAWAIERKP